MLAVFARSASVSAWPPSNPFPPPKLSFLCSAVQTPLLHSSQSTLTNQKLAPVPHNQKRFISGLDYIPCTQSAEDAIAGGGQAETEADWPGIKTLPTSFIGKGIIVTLFPGLHPKGQIKQFINAKNFSSDCFPYWMEVCGGSCCQKLLKCEGILLFFSLKNRLLY